MRGPTTAGAVCLVYLAGVSALVLPGCGDAHEALPPARTPRMVWTQIPVAPVAPWEIPPIRALDDDERLLDAPGGNLVDGAFAVMDHDEFGMSLLVLHREAQAGWRPELDDSPFYWPTGSTRTVDGEEWRAWMRAGELDPAGKPHTSHMQSVSDQLIRPKVERYYAEERWKTPLETAYSTPGSRRNADEGWVRSSDPR